MSTSDGSYTPFEHLESSHENLQDNLSSLEFDFIGFDTTFGISGLPFFGRQNLTSNATMSGSDGEDLARQDSGIEPPAPSEGWLKFQRYASFMLNALGREIESLKKQLAQLSLTQSVPQISSHLFRIQRWREKMAQLDDDIKEVTRSETVPDDQLNKLFDDTADLVTDIDTQHAIIEELLQEARDNSSNKQTLVTAFRDVANSPTVDLPEFHGKTIKYNSFKKNFQFVIEKVNGPKELWATHLVNSLKGSVKQYIGDEGKWFDRYDDLWKVLDNKYANMWTLTNETVSSFFDNYLSSEEPDP